MDFASEEFRLSAKRPDGATLREHLLIAHRGREGLPPRLAEQPPLPPLAAHVWVYFTELHRCRSANGFGLNPISYADILAWQACTRQTIEPWEVRAIQQLDAAYLTAVAENQPKSAEQPGDI